jgi:transcriptional regulator with XRE-family HTH domain
LDPVTLGKRLKHKRRAVFKASLDDLGKPYGLTKGHLSMIERGKIDDPNLDTLIKIADAYKVGLKELTGVFLKDGKKAEEYVKVHAILKQIAADEKHKLGKLVNQALEEKMGEKTKLLIVRLYENIYKKKLL